jgi:hypothetical protein
MAVAERPHRQASRGTVPEQLVSILVELRAEGLMFEQAWDEALRHIVWPESQRETLEWERALEGVQETWRASYERWEPTPGETAVAGLHQGLRAVPAY